MVSKQEKLKNLKSSINSLNKRFGEGSIIQLSDTKNLKVEFISTGNLDIDNTLGGGFARGRISEIFSEHESTGKTTLALNTVADLQKKEGICAYIDTENSFDPTYAENIGVNLGELFFSQPNSGEEAFEIILELLKSESVDMIVLDSIATTVPLSELEGEMGKAQMGSHARLVSQAMRKITKTLSTSKAHLILINQMRSKIGVLFGNPNTPTGGNAVKFYASQRIELRKIEILKKNEVSFGVKIRLHTVKNKVYSPFKKVEYEILLGKGIQQELSLVNIAIKKEVIVRAGAWYTLPDGTRFQGKEKIIDLAKADKEFVKELEKQVRNVLFGEGKIKKATPKIEQEELNLKSKGEPKKEVEKKRNVKKDK